MAEPTMAPSMSVAQYYAGKSVFITGSTGFMGKVLVEKLLRSCPEIGRIYLLLRPKKGQTSKERLEDFANSRVFDRIHEDSPKQLTKLHLIAGDILKEGMAVSNDDRAELQRECHIVFHCAACVRFDQKLKDAVNLNTGGTFWVLQLAETMQQLESFVHVSTAYCRCELATLEERLYRAKHRPQDVLSSVQWMDDPLLDHVEPKIIEPQPNTYAYTKSLTEELVSQYEGKFPIAIARPSIVTAAYKEPLPGWVDNLNGPTGIIVGAGKGVIRSVHCHGHFKADVVPVDMVVNGCIVLAYTTGLDRPKQISVCNITESGVNPLTWNRAIDAGRHHVNEFPFSVCLWYPGGSCKSSYLTHLFAAFFTHVLPAYCIDLLLYMMGQKTFMIRIQKKVATGLKVLQCYTTKDWDFKNEHFLALRKRLSRNDDEVFYTDIKVIDWDLYIRDYVKGAREFCCKENPSTLPQARKLNRQLFYLDKVTKILLSCVFVYFIYYYGKMLLSVF